MPKLNRMAAAVRFPASERLPGRPGADKGRLSSDPGAGHAPALLRAAVAGLGAAAAVVVLVLIALGGAGIADFGAEPAEVVNEPGTATHERGRSPAEGRTVAVEADALRQVRHVGFVETGVGAVLTLLGTLETGFDTGVMLLVGHGCSPFYGNEV